MEDSLMSRTFEEQHLLEIEIICNIIHLILLSHYTVFFHQVIASLVNKSNNIFQNKTFHSNPKILNDSILYVY